MATEARCPWTASLGHKTEGNEGGADGGETPIYLSEAGLLPLLKAIYNPKTYITQWTKSMAER